MSPEVIAREYLIVLDPQRKLLTEGKLDFAFEIKQAVIHGYKIGVQEMSEI